MHAAVKLNKIELRTVLATVLQGIFPQLGPDRGHNLPDLTLFVQLQPSLLSSIRLAWSLSDYRSDIAISTSSKAHWPGNASVCLIIALDKNSAPTLEHHFSDCGQLVGSGCRGRLATTGQGLHTSPDHGSITATSHSLSERQITEGKKKSLRTLSFPSI